MKTNVFFLKMGGGKSHLTLILLMFISSFYAQENDFCAFDEGEIPESAKVYVPFIDDPSQNMEPIVFNVFFWKVNDSEGNYYNNNFTEYNILAGVAHLNRTFNKFNIFFKYVGYDTFNSPTFVPLILREWNPVEEEWECNTYQGGDPTGYGMIRWCQRGIFFNYVTNNGYRNPNAINIYAPYATEGYRGAASYSRSSVIVKPEDFSNFVNPHEIAHLFAIGHTWSETENVPRNPSHPDFNADETADWIIQTNAINTYRDPNNPSTYPFVDLNDCTYENDGFQIDNEGHLYAPSHYDVSNIMGNCSPCMMQYPYFFPEQGLKMRHQILTYPSLFGPKQTTIASLYEPYKGEYYIAGPLQGATFEENQSIYKPLFQPGFKYRFRACDCDCPDGEPTPYEDTSFNIGNFTLSSFEPDETNFNLITHPNHSAIQIIFNPPLPNTYGQNTRKCYDNWNRAPIGGSVTKFNDGVFNANVTITTQDSTAINNPNLIQQLNPGLYKIEKIYEDGAVQENVLYKDNE